MNYAGIIAFILFVIPFWFLLRTLFNISRSLSSIADGLERIADRGEEFTS